MKSIKRRFISLTKLNQYWSTYTCFAEAIYGQHFNRTIICRWFNKLVDKNDYALKNKKAILAFLESV